MNWRAITRQARKKKYFLSVARDSTTFSGARELIGEMTVQKLPYTSMANSLQIGAAGWGWVENPSELL